MRFSSFKQILGITLAWAIVLFAVDYLKNPRAAAEVFGRKPHESTVHDKPHLSIWMNHLCCSGCAGDAQTALSTVAGLGRAEVPSEAQLKTNDPSHIEVEVTNLELLDFVSLARAMENAGLVPERVDFSGAAHFRLVAELKHLCCAECSRSLESGLGIAKALRATGQFGWIDSVTVSKEKRRVVAHARYDKTVDISEFVAALNRMGFAPASLRVSVGSEI
jgi:hypothetical protein